MSLHTLVNAAFLTFGFLGDRVSGLSGHCSRYIGLYNTIQQLGREDAGRVSRRSRRRHISRLRHHVAIHEERPPGGKDLGLRDYESKYIHGRCLCHHFVQRTNVGRPFAGSYVFGIVRNRLDMFGHYHIQTGHFDKG